MASRVNTKFVAIMGGALLAAFIGVAYLGVQAVRKSGEDYIAMGDKALAEKKTGAAVGFYSKAVFKDQKNPAWIRKWLTAMEQHIPSGKGKYAEEYQTQYLRALKALPEADRTDLDAHVRYLDEVYKGIKSGGTSLGELEYMIRVADEMIKNYKGDESTGKRLLRYRAIPKMAVTLRNPEFKPDEVLEIQRELEAAVKADPTDSESLLSASQIDMALAERARKRDEKEEADRLLQSAKSRMTRYVAEHPPASNVRLALLMQEAQAAAQASGKPVTISELLQDRKPQLQELLDAIKSEDAATLEVPTVSNAAAYAQLAFSPEEGRREADAVMDKMLAARPNDPPLLMAEASLQRMRNEPDAALATLQKIVDMPDIPLSHDGLALFQHRVRAVQLQTDVVFEQWEKERDPAKKAALVQKAKKYRDELVGRIGEAEIAVLSIDARLAYLEGDRNGARALLTRYNDQTGQRDPQSMALLGELLLAQGSTGAAKQTFERVLALDGSNQRALGQLARMEMQAKNYAESARYLRELLKYNPNDAALRSQVEELTKASSPNSSDPVVALLLEADRLTAGVGADYGAAIKLIEDFLKTRTDDARPYYALLQLYYRNGQKAEAVATLDRAIAQFPADERLKQLRTNLTEENPLETALERIKNSTTLSPLDKAVQSFAVLKEAGQHERAKPFFEEMIRLDPEDPTVVEYRFQDAMERKESAKVTEIVALAERKNIDKVSGLTFKARQQITEKQLPEAKQSLQSALERDKLNHVAWRLLGMVCMNTGDLACAKDAFSKAIEIRPDDVITIIGYVRVLWATDDQTGALAAARKYERFAGNNPEFTEMFLQIESMAPGGNKDKAAALRKRLIELRPDNKANKAELALLLIEQRKFDEARDVIESLKGDENTRDGVAELEARWYALQGKYAEAEKVYEDLIKSKAPGTVTEQYYIAPSRLFMMVGQPDRAIAMLERGRAIEKKETMLISREMGDTLYNAGKKREAIEAYKRVLDSGASDPNDAVAKRILEAYASLEDWSKFDEMMTAMGEKAQKDTTLVLLSAGAAAAQGDRVRAERLYNQAVVLEPTNPMVFLKRGEFWMTDPTRERDAIADFQQAAKLAPNSTIPLMRLALLYKQTRKIDLAAEELQKALAIDPEDDGLRAELISIRVAQNRQTEAITLVDDAVKLKPDSLPWLMRAGGLMTQIGRIDLAPKYYQKAWDLKKALDVAVPYVTALIAMNPPDPATAWRVASDKALNPEEVSVRMLKAMVMQRTGRGAEVDAELARAYESVDPKNAQACQLFAAGIDSTYAEDNRGRLAAWGKLDARRKLTDWMYVQAALARMKEPTMQAKAATDLATFVEQGADASMKLSVYRLLGSYYYQTDQYPQSVAEYRKFLTIDPNDAEVNNNVAYILATELKQPADALPFAQKAAESAPDSPNVLDTLGVVQLGLRDVDNAVQTLLKAVDRSKTENDRIPAQLHLARAYHAKSALTEAKQTLNRVYDTLESNATLKQQYENELKEVQKLLDGQ